MECVRCTFEEFSSIYGVQYLRRSSYDSIRQSEKSLCFYSLASNAWNVWGITRSELANSSPSISLPRYHFPHLIIVICIYLFAEWFLYLIRRINMCKSNIVQFLFCIQYNRCYFCCSCCCCVWKGGGSNQRLQFSIDQHSALSFEDTVNTHSSMNVVLLLYRRLTRGACK